MKSRTVISGRHDAATPGRVAIHLEGGKKIWRVGRLDHEFWAFPGEWLCRSKTRVLGFFVGSRCAQCGLGPAEFLGSSVR